jgi:hypothetical protein
MTRARGMIRAAVLAIAFLLAGAVRAEDKSALD